MCVYIRTVKTIYIHTYTYCEDYIHTYIYIYIYLYIYYVYAYIYIYIYIYYAYIISHAHARWLDKRVCTQTYCDRMILLRNCAPRRAPYMKYAHIHTHIHTYIQTYCDRMILSTRGVKLCTTPCSMRHACASSHNFSANQKCSVLSYAREYTAMCKQAMVHVSQLWCMYRVPPLAK
jgi:hypothetical protein